MRELAFDNLSATDDRLRNNIIEYLVKAAKDQKSGITNGRYHKTLRQIMSDNMVKPCDVLVRVLIRPYPGQDYAAYKNIAGSWYEDLQFCTRMGWIYYSIDDAINETTVMRQFDICRMFGCFSKSQVAE